MVRKQKEEASHQKRRDAANQFHRDVKRACCYSIPWAVAVMEDACAFLRNLPNMVMPVVDLFEGDHVFGQSDKEKFGKQSLRIESLRELYG